MYCMILYAGTLRRIKMLFPKSVFCSWQNWVAATSHFLSVLTHAWLLPCLGPPSRVGDDGMSLLNTVVLPKVQTSYQKKNLLITWYNKPFYTSNAIDNCSILKIRKLRQRRPEVRCLTNMGGRMRGFFGLSQFPCSLRLPINHIYWEASVRESAAFVGHLWI